ncbi:hypothetical protein CKQ84_19110 [Shewanella sp. WE21]|jgi:hypothetical protein|uniref:hypothetical protein n=1 Tax=Shewanella sp. WE21 TaxID=2029986 RepID=UPI000CF6D002|nr:hypothetical protein [Shewanella sp. WE21]AVI67779.1 hypothetical protein CKQ84_19110 [Shewanella sp. WE21]
MFSSALSNRALLSLNVSTCELQKLEKLDVKKIKAVDISRLQQTILSTNNIVKKQRILKTLNKIGQHNESGVHILSKYSPEKVLDLTLCSGQQYLTTALKTKNT